MPKSVEGVTEWGRTWKGRTRRRIRYAKKPPNCEAMRKANEKLWKEHPELKRRKLTMSPDKNETWLRIEWMDYYSEFCGEDRDKYITTINPQLKPGELAKYCKERSTPPPEPSTGNLVITILDSLRPGRKVVTAEVDILGPENRGPEHVDFVGRITFCSLKPGDYSILVSAPDYKNETAKCQVRGEAIEKMDITLEPLIGDLVVIVLGDFDKRLKNANVQLAGEKFSEKKITDEHGTVKFENLKARSYSVYAWKRTKTEHYSTDVKVFVEVQARRQPPTEISIKLKLTKPCNLEVVVQDWDLKEVDQAKVSLLSATSDGKPVIIPGGIYRTVYSDHNGRYVFENLQKGNYVVKAEKMIQHINPEYPLQGYTVGSKPKTILIYNPGSTPIVKLILEDPRTKEMKIRVAWAEYKSISISGVLGVGAEIHFEIWDLERRKIQKYLAEASLIGLELGLIPVGGGQTKPKNPDDDWTHPFKVPRFVKGKVMDETTFEGRVGIAAAQTTGMIFNVTFYEIPFPTGIWQHIPFAHAKVVGIEVGETTWEPPSISGTFTTGSNFVKI
jgi:hypothetical protein